MSLHPQPQEPLLQFADDIRERITHEVPEDKVPEYWGELQWVVPERLAALSGSRTSNATHEDISPISDEDLVVIEDYLDGNKKLPEEWIALFALLILCRLNIRVILQPWGSPKNGVGVINKKARELAGNIYDEDGTMSEERAEKFLEYIMDYKAVISL